jgi:BirA family transcriptional regulator, biotin operon repressor / biotin---[acetyl-CoA-carboxylase] ligase
MAAEQRFQVSTFLAALREVGCSLGEPFQYAQVTGSTNDDARAALRAGAASGAVFLADAQTQGRGRRGRSWLAPQGAGLWFTVGLRPRVRASELATLTLVVGVAVRRALSRHTDAALSLKWPNDIEAAGRKLAGILVEAETASGGTPALAIGIGINTALGFDGTELGHAVSLDELGPMPSREALLVSVLKELEHWLGLHERDGVACILSELRAHDALLGQAVRVEGVQGVGSGFDALGRLLLETPTGIVPFSSGTVERA